MNYEFKMMNSMRSAVDAFRRHKWAGRLVAAGVLALSFIIYNSQFITVFAQQPQAPAGTPLYSVNAKYVNGMAPGYWPTAGTGLVLNLSSGTAYCGNPPVPVSYPGGSLALTASTTNYVYLDPASDCSPMASMAAFAAGQIPVATVVTGASSITSITDARTWFTPQPCVTGSAGDLHCSSLGTNQNIALSPSGSGATVITNLADKGGQVFNVKAYGATGDGSTSDSTAINSAIAAACAAGGGIVKLPPGAYAITATLDVTCNSVTIKGSGNGVQGSEGLGAGNNPSTATTIVASGLTSGQDAVVAEIPVAARTNGYNARISGFHIKGLTIDMNSQTGAAVRTVTCWMCSVEHVTVLNANSTGGVIVQQAGTSASTYGHDSYYMRESDDQVYVAAGNTTAHAFMYDCSDGEIGYGTYSYLWARGVIDATGSGDAPFYVLTSSARSNSDFDESKFSNIKGTNPVAGTYGVELVATGDYSTSTSGMVDNVSIDHAQLERLGMASGGTAIGCYNGNAASGTGCGGITITNSHSDSFGLIDVANLGTRALDINDDTGGPSAARGSIYSAGPIDLTGSGGVYKLSGQNINGTCSMVSATSCTSTVTSGTHCVATVQGTSPIASACQISGGTLTVTAASSNNETWAWHITD